MKDAKAPAPAETAEAKEARELKEAAEAKKKALAEIVHGARIISTTAHITRASETLLGVFLSRICLFYFF